MKLISAPALKPGALIGIFTPSSPSNVRIGLPDPGQPRQAERAVSREPVLHDSYLTPLY